jgi:two-component system cell cycle sensor histidine kinase/response regulator CckA
LAISDNGQGMDQQTLTRIFDPFFTTKEVGKGTGLGLATVYGIIKQSGGSINVYSEPGQGTVFKIYLKAMGLDKQTDVSHSLQPDTLLSGVEIVLVVEDEEPVRELVVIVLEKYGYTVLQAADGEEALAMVQQGGIDLLLTDVIMPGVSGRVVAERALAINPGMKILYMSGYTDNAIVHHGVLDEGANFIQKPFSPIALLQKIRQVLNEKVKSSE